jgi:transcriptional regulator with XRE-family HTH domain
MNTPLNEFYARIGSRLHTIRHARNEKIIVVAYSIGVSHAVISQIEHGRYKGLSVRTLYLLADYYKISVEELFSSGR